MLYFNENDAFMAQWCRNAFRGEVDERDIRTIEHPALAVRQHYFAGIGGWEYALRLAGWPEDREVWTGSCPCQPFSVAGKREAHEDERDLWPAFFRLIAVARPAIVLGEQVSGAIAFGWLDRVCDDLEGIGYAVGSAVLPACSVGAPQIRQRLYWVAIRLGDSDREGRAGLRKPEHAEQQGAQGFLFNGSSAGRFRNGTTGGVGDSDPSRREGRSLGPEQRTDQLSAWAASSPVCCTDGRWRRVPIKPELFPVADGGRFGNPRADRKLSSRIAALKGAGNAIVIPLAAEFIMAAKDLTLDDFSQRTRL